MGSGGGSKGPTPAEKRLRIVQGAQAAELRKREREAKRASASRSRAIAATRATGGQISRGNTASLVSSAFGSKLTGKLGTTSSGTAK